jgi:hypothetical protein
MNRLSKGDQVRADIPDVTDTDHELYHGRCGEIIEVVQDDAGTVTGDKRDSRIYRVEFENGEVVDFRWRDLRPP